MALGRRTLATADRDAAARGIIMSTDAATPAPKGWRDSLRPYREPAPLAALFLGISPGFPFALIGATLTTRSALGGIDNMSVTAFARTFLACIMKGDRKSYGWEKR